MAAERLTKEVEIKDLPKIDLGNFNWQPVDRVFARQTRVPDTANDTAAQIPIAQQVLEKGADLFEPARPLTSDEFPLNLLQDRTFAGTGYNTIWRPRSKEALDPKIEGDALDVLELNLTAETMAFSKSLGDVPNRGVSLQADLTLKGISYVQRIGAFENPDTGSNDNKAPKGIHFEPGVFMFVPACKVKPPGHPATINRMASIPHGTTINAQGPVPSFEQFKLNRAVNVGDRGDIPATNIVPFKTNTDPKVPQPKNFKNHLDFEGRVQDNRIPTPLPKFNKTITKEIFTDPNQVLRNALAGQKIINFETFELTTKASAPLRGGGTANIGFLQGTDNLEELSTGDSGNAHAAKMTVRYWIETVAATLTIKAKSTEPQVFRMSSAAGVLGPTYVVPVAASASLSANVNKQVTWTQIQYSQDVTLNFNGLSWPHISVATLGDTTKEELTAEKIAKLPTVNT